MFVQAGIEFYGGSPIQGFNIGLTELPVSTPPALTFATTAVGSTASNSGQTVVLENYGNQPMVFSQVSYPVDFPETQPADSSYCAAGSSLQPGEQCVVRVDFEPIDATTITILRESVNLTRSAAGSKAVTQGIPLVGYATPAVSNLARKK
jgi:hypothetical protein